MIRMSKLTDYGIVLLAQLALRQERVPRTARDLAAATRLPLPVVSKLLKGLAREGLLASHRGANGGYSLACDPATLSVADMIAILEGPVALTECGAHPGLCTQERDCRVRAPWQRINEVIQGALARVTLAELIDASWLPSQPQDAALAILSVPPTVATCAPERAR